MELVALPGLPPGTMGVVSVSTDGCIQVMALAPTALTVVHRLAERDYDMVPLLNVAVIVVCVTPLLCLCSWCRLRYCHPLHPSCLLLFYVDERYPRVALFRFVAPRDCVCLLAQDGGVEVYKAAGDTGIVQSGTIPKELVGASHVSTILRVAAVPDAFMTLSASGTVAVWKFV
jgi:hypothetical protein